MNLFSLLLALFASLFGTPHRPCDGPLRATTVGHPGIQCPPPVVGRPPQDRS